MIKLDNSCYAVFDEKEQCYDVYSRNGTHLGTALTEDDATLIAINEG